MSVLQHYYTSFVNRENGSAGFQVKAMSPGIPPDTQSTITRLIAYRIPPTLTEYDISRHPIALRYYYEGTHRSILLCSQSNGADENGRPGNFFAHTLVLEPDKFKRIPPILYWRSPFWRTKDPGTNTSINPLSNFDEEPTLDIENVWSFLAQRRRVEYFQKLMSAVIHCNTSHRRIVIIDTADNVAMWVAAVSCMLPPDYRPMLSFATYHHDPYQAQFMITGTTSDSSFRASSEEYMSFFILNAETGKISDVESSPYAEETAISARSIDEYESRLLNLFMRYPQRFPAPTVIDEQLDQMVRYARVLNQQNQIVLTSDDLQAISQALTIFEQSNKFTREDLLELNHLGITLSNAYETQPQLEQTIYKEYSRIVALQKEHQIPTDEAAMNDLKRFTQRLVRDSHLEQVLARLSNLRQTYGEDMFLSTVNHPDYLQWQYQLLKSANVQQLADVWTYLGSYIRMNQQSHRLLVLSLSMLGTLRQAKRSKEGSPLLNAIVNAAAGREQEVLELAAAHYQELPPETLEHFYCRFVTRFDLEMRVPYRTIVQRVCSDIHIYELRYEVSRGGIENGLVALERWIDHAKRQRMTSIPVLIDEGLHRLQLLYQNLPQQWYELVPSILTSKSLEPLPQDWEDHLVDTALSKVSLSHFSPTDIKMCKKYQTRRGLSEETRTVVDGLLAMESGELDVDLQERLHKRFIHLPPHAYQEEAHHFIREFLHKCASKESHNFMVNAIFTWDHSEYFWQPYWETLSEMLIHASSVDQAIRLLTYWFTTTPDTFQMPYTAHYFLLSLPQKLEEVQKVRGFQNVVRQINSLSEKQKLEWHPLVQNYFVGRKNVFVSVGQSLAEQLQKRRASQNTEEEARVRAAREKEELDARVATLFEGQKIRQSHKQNLLSVYRGEQLEQFWASYWEKFTQVLLSRDADSILELLAFWFDESFETLLKMHVIPQGFFLGLVEALEAAKKERSFRERARQISAKGIKNTQAYPWYGIVQDYFAEQERRFPFFRRGSSS